MVIKIIKRRIRKLRKEIFKKQVGKILKNGSDMEVQVLIKGNSLPEIIFNFNHSIKNKLKYYLDNYNEDMKLIHKPNDVAIIKVTEIPNKVTKDAIIDNIAGWEKIQSGPKTTIIKARLRNGFEIVESSSCVDPANYDEALGIRICLDKIESKVWELLGFELQQRKRSFHTVSKV